MNITIDGRAVFVPGPSTVLEAARANGIDIPTLCDHAPLRPFGGCRLCLVEIKGRRDFAPACGTAVEDGLEIRTETPELAALRRGILELILSEHPNACLICAEKDACDDFKATIRKTGEVTGCVQCPVNGACELQRVVERVGVKCVPYPARRREGEIRREDAFIDRDNSLCVLCGRCVRVCQEVRGASVLTFVARGSETVVDTALGRTLLDSGCQFCGACVDACPTGALTERAARPEPAPERTTRSICPLCSLGCTLDIRSRGDRLVSAAPSTHGPVNKGQGCVKGRFVLGAAVTGGHRILEPHVRKDGELRPASFDDALTIAAECLRCVAARETAFVLSAQSSLEEMYVLGKWASAMGAGGCSVASPASPAAVLGKAGVDLDFRLEEIASARSVVLLGVDPAVSHPLIWLEIWKALQNGARLLSIGNLPQTAAAHITRELRPRPGREAEALAMLSRALVEAGVPGPVRAIPGFDKLKRSLERMPHGGAGAALEGDLAGFAADMGAGASTIILVGRDYFIPSAGPEAAAAVRDFALLAQARLIPLAVSSNGRGWLSIRRIFGTAEMAPGEIQSGLRSRSIKALYLAGRAFDLGGSRPDVLIGQGPLWNEALLQADVVFPSCTVLETPGSFVNAEGRRQSWTETLPPAGGSKPGWWITAALAREMKLGGFDFESAADVDEDLGHRTERAGAAAGAKKDVRVPSFQSLPRWPDPPESDPDHPFLLKSAPPPDLYRGLDLAEDSPGLRRVRRSGAIWMNPADAADSGIRDGETVCVATASTDFRAECRTHASVPRGALRAAAGALLPGGVVPARVTKVPR